MRIPAFLQPLLFARPQLRRFISSKRSGRVLLPCEGEQGAGAYVLNLKGAKDFRVFGSRVVRDAIFDDVKEKAI